MISFQSDSFSWQDGADGLTLTIKTPQAKQIAESLDGQYTVEIKEYHEVRSKEANRFLWSILGKCALILRTTKEELYRKYVPKVAPFRDWDLPEDRVSTFCHVWEAQGTGWVTERVDYAGDGDLITIRAYYGSSTFTKKRMSYMIDMVVEDAKELGVDCLTEKERSLLIEKWQPVRIKK